MVHILYFELGGFSSTGSSLGVVLVLFAITHFRETWTLYMLVGLLGGWVCEACGGGLN